MNMRMCPSLLLGPVPGALPALQAHKMRTRESNGANPVCVIWLAAAVSILAAAPTFGEEARFISIDVPGAAYTAIAAINDKGDSVGYYDVAGVDHGFIRDKQGAFTTFDVLYAGFIYPQSINGNGMIAGFTYSGSAQGFVRDENGVSTTFNPLGSIETIPLSINAKGKIAGYYFADALHGFLRDEDGTITSLDVLPGATYIGSQCINRRGEIAGSYGLHAAVRDKDGTVTQFDVPGATSTRGMAINAQGEIAGNFTMNGIDQGFVRDENGSITTFQVPGATRGVVPVSIDTSGQVVGYYNDAAGSHGFVRDEDGKITSFDVPGGVYTSVAGSNNRGEIVGQYSRPGNPYTHSYLRVRRQEREE